MGYKSLRVYPCPFCIKKTNLDSNRCIEHAIKRRVGLCTASRLIDFRIGEMPLDKRFHCVCGDIRPNTPKKKKKKGGGGGLWLHFSICKFDLQDPTKVLAWKLWKGWLCVIYDLRAHHIPSHHCIMMCNSWKLCYITLPPALPFHFCSPLITLIALITLTTPTTLITLIIQDAILVLASGRAQTRILLQKTSSGNQRPYWLWHPKRSSQEMDIRV